MKAEFLRDDWGTIWFSFARDIYGRPSQNKHKMSTLDAKKQAKKM